MKGMTVSDIFAKDGTLDYAAAVRALTASRHTSSENRRRLEIDHVAAAALIDIAAGVGILTHNLIVIGEYLGAYDDRHDDTPGEPVVGPDGEPQGEPERKTDDPIDVGDWVDVGEWVGAPHPSGVYEPGQVTAMGVTEGATWAEVNGRRYYVTDLARGHPELVDETPDPADEFDGTEHEHTLNSEDPASSIDEDDEAPDPADMVEEIDDDFEAPAAAASEPAALRCGAPHPTVEGVTCSRKLDLVGEGLPADVAHAGKHRKGNLKWA